MTLLAPPVLSPADYAEGAVVSRKLLKTPAGSATLFAFDAGEGLSEHTSTSEALVLVTDGTAEVTLCGETHRVGPGEAIVLPADVPHALHAPERFQMLLVLLRPH